MLRLMLATALASVAIPAAHGQTTVQPLSPTVRATFLPQQGGNGEVRVQVHAMFFVPGPIDSSEASLTAQVNARQTLYETAGKECEVLLKTLAGTCRLDNINISIQRGYNSPQVEGFNASGNFNYRITTK